MLRRIRKKKNDGLDGERARPRARGEVLVAMKASVRRATLQGASRIPVGGGRSRFAGPCEARRGGAGNWWEEGLGSDKFGDDSSSDVRRERAQRLRDAGGDYDARLNQRLRSSVATSAPSYDPLDEDPDEGDSSSQNRGLLTKIGKAWRIFFPEKKRNISNLPAREAAKSRLRMILVADRNSLSSEVMEDMKQTIVSALGDYVELESNKDINLSMRNDDKEGTVYSVSVPVKCVKPEKRSYFSPDGIVEDGDISQDNWDAWDEDPKSRFPWGT